MSSRNGGATGEADHFNEGPRSYGWNPQVQWGPISRVAIKRKTPSSGDSWHKKNLI